MKLEKTDSEGWSYDVTFLRLVSPLPQASGKGRYPVERPFLLVPCSGAGSTICWHLAAKRAQESEKWERKLPISTAVTWGHAVRSYKGIKASLFRWFLSGQLIS